MEDASKTEKNLSYDSDNDDLGSINSDDINPSRLLSDLQGVYQHHLMQIGTADEERNKTYSVNHLNKYSKIAFLSYVMFFH